MADAAAAAFARLDLDGDLPGAVAYRTGETILTATPAEAESRYPGLRGASRSSPGFVAIPLVVSGECLGVLAFGSGRPRRDSGRAASRPSRRSCGGWYGRAARFERARGA